MNGEIITILFVFLILLFLGSVAMSIFLLYDIKSGNYRKFLSTGENTCGAGGKGAGSWQSELG